MKITPQNYVKPPDAVKPTNEELQTQRQAMKQRIKEIVNGKNKPCSYYDVAMQLQREGFNSPWINPMEMVEAVDRQWHPEKFEPPVVPPPKGK